ncbi:MAG: DUF4105 domain-containing protein [Marinilabiliales bacterium]|nr:DUF4105 domain-containing protein [Marinilabiliales bacterium]
MVKKMLWLVLFTLAFSGVQAQTLSPSAKVSLLICAPGDEIYSYFGHAAIRVSDPSAALDIVFNYGVFDFTAPHFIWRFAKGETDYLLVGMRMDTFLMEYKEEKRKVVEYPLLLTQQEKETIFQALVINNLPQNRMYRYSHFADNCSTRLRDQIERATAGKLQYDKSGDQVMTFRNLIDCYVEDNSWSGLGIKLALGIPTDARADFSQKMFIPDYLGQAMLGAHVVREGVVTHLALPAVTVLEEPPIGHPFSLLSPGVILLLVFVVILWLSWKEWKSGRPYHWLDLLVFMAFGVAGLILAFTTFISVMPSTKWNLNLIWASPIHFLLALLWMVTSLRKYLKAYVVFSFWVTFLFLVSMGFLPQTFHWLVVPLCLIWLVRTGLIMQREGIRFFPFLPVKG